MNLIQHRRFIVIEEIISPDVFSFYSLLFNSIISVFNSILDRKDDHFKKTKMSTFDLIPSIVIKRITNFDREEVCNTGREGGRERRRTRVRFK